MLKFFGKRTKTIIRGNSNALKTLIATYTREVDYHMKIELNGGYNIYRKNVSGDKSVKGEAAGEIKKAADTDVLEISRGNTAIADKGFAALKSRLQSDINLPASADRIEELRAAVKNGSYHIPTEVLVDSILSE